MKTTLNLRDDLVRRAKARAALQGKPLARYIEEGIEQRLLKEESQIDLPHRVGSIVANHFQVRGKGNRWPVFRSKLPPDRFWNVGR